MKSLAALFVIVFTIACGSEPVPPMSSDGGVPTVTTGSNDGGPSGCASPEDCIYPDRAWCVITNGVGVCTLVSCEGGCNNGWVCDTVAEPNHCRPPDAPAPDAGTICDQFNCGVGMTCIALENGHGECRAIDGGTTIVIAMPDAGVVEQQDSGTTPQIDAGTTVVTCSQFCPADNTCQVDIANNTITCIPPVVTPVDAGTSVLDAGVTQPIDAGVAPADAGVTPADAGTQPTLGCTDVCPVGNTCVIDIERRLIVCVPPTPVDAGTLPQPDAGVTIADAGTTILDAGVSILDAGVVAADAGVVVVSDAGTQVLDAGTVIVVDAGTTPVDAGTSVLDAGVVVADAGVAPADAGVLPADGGVAAPVDGGAAPTVPTNARGVLRIRFDPARIRSDCGSPVLVAWNNPPDNFRVPTVGNGLAYDFTIVHAGTLDTTIRCGLSSADYPGFNGTGQLANAVGYIEATMYLPGGQSGSILATAIICGGKVRFELEGRAQTCQ